MVPVSHLPKLIAHTRRSYRSVFMFSEEDAEIIREQGSSRGFKRCDVWADTLFIDLDNGEIDLPKCVQFLKERNLSAEIWESGGKGFHIEIETILQHGKHLPYSHQEFVKTLGISADYSIYRHSSLIRLAGSIHERTGKRKRLILKFEGQKLEVEMKTPSMFGELQFSETPELQKSLDKALLRAASTLVINPSPGNRHMTVWGLAKDFAGAGLEYSVALGLIQAINLKWSTPKPPQDVEKAVRQGYGLPLSY